MPKRNKKVVGGREKALMLITFVALVLASVVLLSPRQGTQEVSGGGLASVSDLSTDGFVTVTPLADFGNNSGILSLESDCYRMVAGTEVGQAKSIKDGLEGATGPRPNTHEVMRDMFKALDIELLMAKVTELRGDNFFGKIILKQGSTILSLDSKPSDGIALAIRTGTKIYFNETLMEEKGQKIC